MLHKGHEYLIEDLYCSNPDCNCKEVHLQFFKIIRELSEKTSIIDCFMAELSFKKGRMQISELFKSNKHDAEELISAWKAQHTDILNLFQDRYRKIKEIGERSLKGKGLHKIPDAGSKPLSQSVVREKKIGRNEPCPCGSGKKYKKCCGA